MLYEPRSISHNGTVSYLEPILFCNPIAILQILLIQSSNSSTYTLTLSTVSPGLAHA